jgi:hypothetical protein
MLHLHRVALEKFGNNKSIRIRSCLRSVIFPFSSKINKNGCLSLFYKIKSWKQIFISHLVCFWVPSEKIFTNTMMQGKKHSNAKMKRKSGAFRRPPGQTLWLAGHILWPSDPRQIQKCPYASRKCMVTLDYAVLVSKSWYWFKTFQIFNFWSIFLLSMS